MMECPEYRLLRKEYLYPILLELNDERKFNVKELFVQILTTKHYDFIVNIAKCIQNVMVKQNCKALK